MEKNFGTFMSQLRETNQTLGFFCDFDKISNNVENIKLSLCMLNSLIGTNDLRRSVKTIWERDKTAFNILDILIAVRSNGQKKVLNANGECVVLDSFFESVDSVVEYLEDTGLAHILKEGRIKNLVDYVFGIETGLDSNARKNRGGDNMSKAVSLLFDREEVYYKKEVNSTLFLDIESLGVDVKRFDFVIKTKKKTYLIETNFYNTGGSKLNEVARAYSEVAPKINQYENYEFVWITDGQG